jgi:hypothetical protein
VVRRILLITCPCDELNHCLRDLARERADARKIECGLVSGGQHVVGIGVHVDAVDATPVRAIKILAVREVEPVGRVGCEDQRVCRVVADLSANRSGLISLSTHLRKQLFVFGKITRCHGREKVARIMIFSSHNWSLWR